MMKNFIFKWGVKIEGGWEIKRGGWGGQKNFVSE